jgi:hypothetical protein
MGGTSRFHLLNAECRNGGKHIATVSLHGEKQEIRISCRFSPSEEKEAIFD